jgi:P-type Ca2+ transporter type 2C
LKPLHTPPFALSGLSEEQAHARLAEEGHNELATAKPRHVLAIALEVGREPMFLLLVVCGLIYLALGEPREALVLLIAVAVVIGITFFQERKSERALEALRDLSSPRARVVRGGREQRIAGRDVVRDDLVVLAEGDRVPADALVLDSVNLSADESLLTGESVAVRKVAAKGDAVVSTRPGGDDLPFVYSGTLVVQGRGLARVLATGQRTELGKIGKALRGIDVSSTRLQQEMRLLVRRMAIWGLLLCTLVVGLYGLLRGGWLDGLLAGLALAMSVLPEEFPVVLTVFLALGAWRISRQHVLTRRVPAVETLGSATVLCVDKTGTLTENRMTVSKLAVENEHHTIGAGSSPPLPESFHRLVEFAVLASHRDPFDPMEKAITALSERHLADTEHLHKDWMLVREYPLSPRLLAMSLVWRAPSGDAYVIAAKGAPEAIAELCHLAEPQLGRLNTEVRVLAQEGLRVLGVACTRFEPPGLPPEQHDFAFEFLGLVGLADPIRPAVPGAVKQCYQAGMRVIMITGDYPDTAKNIAKQIGLQANDDCLTGAELEAMSDAALANRIKHVNIFARAVPEQKLRLVQALKANGEVVAMTGDGVNDAPALRAADIGIAMGGRGTDVAREAAALVLLDDNFASIVEAVRLGRRIFDNLKKAIAYIFAVHLPIAGLSLLPIVFGWPLILMPVHIAFLELIIDPACSIAFEAEDEESNVMRRPPRASADRLFSLRSLGMSLMQGALALGLVLALLLWMMGQERSDGEIRALVFCALVFANLGLIVTNRSWTRNVWALLASRNAAFWWIIAATGLCVAAILNVPHLREVFRFGVLSLGDLAVAVAVALFMISVLEVLKPLFRFATAGKGQH